MNQLLAGVIEWGVNNKYPEAINKRIKLTNQLSLILLIPFLLFLITAAVFEMYLYFLNISMIMLICLIVPFLNSHSFTHAGRLLLSAGSTLGITICSVIVNVYYPEQANLTVGIASRVFLLCFATLPLVIFSAEEGVLMWYGFVAASVCVLFFDELHFMFGVDLRQLKYLPWKHDILRAAISITFLTVTLFFYLTQGVHERYEERIEQQNEQLRELNQLKDKLLSIIAHDLRSPLNSLKGSIELMQGTHMSPDDFQEITKKIGNKLDRTLGEMDNILHWARAQMNGMRVAAQRISLAQYVHTAVELYRPHALAKQISLVNEVPAHLVVHVDPDMLMIVFRNLLSNALKFTPRTGLITLSASEGDGYITMHIRDTGIGMTPEELNKVIHGSGGYSVIGTENEKGSGLGLVLCKEFIHKNGGVLQVRSKLGHGTMFSFSLPSDNEVGTNTNITAPCMTFDTFSA